jgi:hypothetical protein
VQETIQPKNKKDQAKKYPCDEGRDFHSFLRGILPRVADDAVLFARWAPDNAIRDRILVGILKLYTLREGG